MSIADECGGNGKRHKQTKVIDTKSKNHETTIYRNDRVILKSNVSLREQYDRMMDGKGPIGPDGKTIELHHIGQKCHLNGGKLIEIEKRMHEKYKGPLHFKERMGYESEINRSKFNTFKQNYWKLRAKQMPQFEQFRKNETRKRRIRLKWSNTQHSSLNKHQNYPKAGGIDLMRSVNINGINSIKFKYIKIEHDKITFYDENSKKYHYHYQYPFNQNEIDGIQYGVFQSNRKGIFFSITINSNSYNMQADGIPVDKINNKYESLLNLLENADWRLANFIFGTNIKTDGSLFECNNYKNPHVIRSEYLLNEIGDNKENIEIRKQIKKSIDKFIDRSPHPTFEINPNISASIKDSIICFNSHISPLFISLRGRYNDFVGNTYYDDHALHCLEESIVIKNFHTNYADFNKQFTEIAKLSEMAKIISLLQYAKLNNIKLKTDPITNQSGKESISINIVQDDKKFHFMYNSPHQSVLNHRQILLSQNMMNCFTEKSRRIQIQRYMNLGLLYQNEKKYIDSLQCYCIVTSIYNDYGNENNNDISMHSVTTEAVISSKLRICGILLEIIKNDKEMTIFNELSSVEQQLLSPILSHLELFQKRGELFYLNKLAMLLNDIINTASICGNYKGIATSYMIFASICDHISHLKTINNKNNKNNPMKCLLNVLSTISKGKNFTFDDVAIFDDQTYNTICQALQHSKYAVDREFSARIWLEFVTALNYMVQLYQADENNEYKQDDEKSGTNNLNTLIKISQNGLYHLQNCIECCMIINRFDIGVYVANIVSFLYDNMGNEAEMIMLEHQLINVKQSISNKLNLQIADDLEHIRSKSQYLMGYNKKKAHQIYIKSMKVTGKFYKNTKHHEFANKWDKFYKFEKEIYQKTAQQQQQEISKWQQLLNYGAFIRNKIGAIDDEQLNQKDSNKKALSKKSSNKRPPNTKPSNKNASNTKPSDQKPSNKQYANRKKSCIIL